MVSRNHTKGNEKAGFGIGGGARLGWTVSTRYPWLPRCAPSPTKVVLMMVRATSLLWLVVGVLAGRLALRRSNGFQSSGPVGGRVS